MLRNKIVFISAQPDVPYFHWQVEVMIHNFISHGINPNWIEVLWASDSGKPSQELSALAQRYPYVRFFTYRKTVKNNFGYIPVLRPDILQQHFAVYPELRGETVFYHDSDIIFRELPNFSSLSGDLYWYVSDTVSYIGSKYIKSKSDELFVDMCAIAGIPPEQVEKNEEGSGGAQYLMKGLTSEYWGKVKKTSLLLYKYMADREKLESQNLSDDHRASYNPIQKWCADMWAVLWEGWKMGAQTIITPELDFSWGTSDLVAYEQHPIMHNAGVTDELKHRLFYKGEYINKNPFEADFSYVDQNTASSKYVEAILYAKKHRNLEALL